MQQFSVYGAAAAASLLLLLLLVTQPAVAEETAEAKKRQPEAVVPPDTDPSDLEQELQSSIKEKPAQQQQQQQQQQHEGHEHHAKEHEEHPAKQQQQQQQQQQHHSEAKQHEAHANAAVDREDLLNMFRHLMTESERRSLRVRIDPAEVKRTLAEMKDEARLRVDRRSSSPSSPAPRSSHSQPESAALSRSRSLRMRRSLLHRSQESSMSSASPRRQKRDVPDWEVARMYRDALRSLRGYSERPDGSILPMEDGDGDGEEVEAPMLREARREPIFADSLADIVDNIAERPRPEEEAAAEAALLPPPPPPGAPADGDEDEGPLTMFLVRLAGEKGLFVPLDQEAAGRAVEAMEEGGVGGEEDEEEDEEDEERLDRRRRGMNELRRFAERLGDRRREAEAEERF